MDSSKILEFNQQTTHIAMAGNAAMRAAEETVILPITEEITYTWKGLLIKTVDPSELYRFLLQEGFFDNSHQSGRQILSHSIDRRGLGSMASLIEGQNIWVLARVYSTTHYFFRADVIR